MTIKPLYAEKDRKFVLDILSHLEPENDLSFLEYSFYLDGSVNMRNYHSNDNYVVFLTSNSSIDLSFINVLKIISNQNMKKGMILVYQINDAIIPGFLSSFPAWRVKVESSEDMKKLCEMVSTSVRNFELHNNLNFREKSNKVDSSNNRKKNILPFSAILSIVCGCSSVFFSLVSDFINVDNSIVISLFIFGTVLCVFGYIIALARINTDKEREDIRNYTQNLRDAISQSFANSKKSNNNVEEIGLKEIGNTALGLMEMNLASIREYYGWSQKQAKYAFVLAVIMCIAGFLLLAFSVAATFLFKEQFEISLISAVGGAIIELIAGTALFVYKKSVNQLNYYHKSLHEDERFLSSVNLISKFSSEDRADSMLEEIIRSEIRMNILGATERNEKDTIKVKTTKNKS